MFGRKIVVLLSSFFLVALLFSGVSASATTMNEDVDVYLPVYNGMERLDDLTCITTDLDSNGSAQLDQDREVGDYSAKVTVDTCPTGGITIGAASESFDIADYSKIKIWVKPGPRASWIQFSLFNSTTNSLIICDQNQDGQFDVGTDLISGQWNEIILDLTQTETPMTQGLSLKINTNDSSTWYFDDIHTVNDSIYYIDLSTTVNDKTEISDGALQSKPHTVDTYDTNPTVLVSERDSSYIITDSAQEDFSGTFINTEAGEDGCIRILSSCDWDACAVGTNAISGGYYGSYLPSYAFDNNQSTYWGSSQINDVYANAFIGYEFSSTNNISYLRLKQYPYYKNMITSAKLQCWQVVEDVGNWIDVQTLPLQRTGEWQSFSIQTTLSSNKWRLLADSHTDGSCWLIVELEMFSASENISYASPAINYVSAQDASISWTGNDVTVKTSVDGGTNWTQVENGWAIPNIESSTPNTLQYKVLLNRLTAQLNDITISIIGEDRDDAPIITSGKISGISVDSNYVLIDGTEVAVSQRPERYLLSFDGKNSWVYYKDGVWTLVSESHTPTLTELEQYGMTIEEINALSEADFASLYAEGRQIYSVDVALKFACPNVNTTPSIKSITVNKTLSDNGNEFIGPTLYAAKEQNFNGTTWRKVKKIYPVELSDRAAVYYYLLYVDDTYKAYKNGAWQNVSSSYLTDVEANWMNLTLEGMTAEELRMVPEAALTNTLAGKNFSIVYVQKVLDTSTQGYTSMINIDYVEDYGTDLDTLTIKQVDGPSLPFTELTDDIVEEFMQWLMERQQNVGPIFYRIDNQFINYYMIQDVIIE